MYTLTDVTIELDENRMELAIYKTQPELGKRNVRIVRLADEYVTDDLARAMSLMEAEK